MQIISTEDGSHTLFIEEINETYHSRHGAIRESQHVFIKNGFRYYIGKRYNSPVHIFELGFGTGLNAVLTASESAKLKLPVTYTAIEPFPVKKEVLQKLNYTTLLPGPSAGAYLAAIHDCSWEKEHVIHPFFKIKKVKNTIEQYCPPKEDFGIIYYDAFAPAKQPEIWDPEILKKAYDMLSENGILLTYCSQGAFKRNLKSTGFFVESLPGPPGKKEMVRAQKQGHSS